MSHEISSSSSIKLGAFHTWKEDSDTFGVDCHGQVYKLVIERPPGIPSEWKLCKPPEGMSKELARLATALQEATGEEPDMCVFPVAEFDGLPPVFKFDGPSMSDMRKADLEARRAIREHLHPKET